MSLKNQLNQLYQISEAQQRAQHGIYDFFYRMSFDKLIDNLLPPAVNPFLQQPDKFDAIEEEDDDAESDKPPPDPIDSMCQQLSQEITAATVASPSSDAAGNNDSSQQVSAPNSIIQLFTTDQILTKRRGGCVSSEGDVIYEWPTLIVLLGPVLPQGHRP